MRIVRENLQTDAREGLIVLEDDQGTQKRYVRRSRNSPILDRKADLVWVEGQPLDFAAGHALNGKNLPDRLMVGLSAGNPRSGALTTAEFVGADDYEANDDAYCVWQACWHRRLGDGELDPDEIRGSLDRTDPKRFGEPWKIKTVVTELAEYRKDKGDRV